MQLGTRSKLRFGGVSGVFTRGLLSGLDLSLYGWLCVARPVLASWPVERVAITDVPSLAFAVARVAGGWRLEARLRVPGRRVPLSGSVAPAGVSGAPLLIDNPADWRVEEAFPDRAALVAGVASASSALVTVLREIAGERWSSPLRKRR